MPLGRLTGSHHSIPQAATTRPAGDFVRREVHAHMAQSMQTRLARHPNWVAWQDGDCHKVTGSPPENGFSAVRDRRARPRFTRLEASIAERPLEWAWQDSPEVDQHSGKGARRVDESSRTWLSARALWIGGIAIALLAAGIISGVATVQSSRPLSLETWVRLDLLQRADDPPGAMHDLLGANRSAGAPDGALPRDGSVAARQDVMAALAGVVAARAHGEADAALASDAGLPPSDAVAIAGLPPSDAVAIAGLGPILASAPAAEQVAADAAMLSLTIGGGSTAGEARLAQPPRPAFKPARVSAMPSDGVARPMSRP